MENPSAHEQIKDAIMNYFWQIDMKNIEGIMACFYENVVVNFLDNAIEGLAGIREFYTELLTAYPHMKHLAYSTIVDDVTDDKAHARCRWYGNSTGEPPLGWGYSLFVFKQKNGVWLITSYDAKTWPAEK